MTPVYKTAEGERLVRERYLAFLKYWPIANEHVRIASKDLRDINDVASKRSPPREFDVPKTC